MREEEKREIAGLQGGGNPEPGSATREYEERKTGMTGGGGGTMKCGVCGMEVSEQPRITEEGKCNQCGRELEHKR